MTNAFVHIFSYERRIMIILSAHIILVNDECLELPEMLPLREIKID